MRTSPVKLAAIGALAIGASLSLLAQQQQPPAAPPPPQQPTEVTVPLVGEGGLPPKLAIAPFLAASSDAETVAAARTITLMRPWRSASHPLMNPDAVVLPELECHGDIRVIDAGNAERFATKLPA